MLKIEFDKNIFVLLCLISDPLTTHREQQDQIILNALY